MTSSKSSFSEKVYKTVKKIPKGKTLTYKEVAKLAGKPKAYRAVGNILNKNYDKNIPCHRVIRSDGKTGGYNRGASKKMEILKGEGVE
jgi:O-6-methylguanine DNA methyltransferase